MSQHNGQMSTTESVENESERDDGEDVQARLDVLEARFDWVDDHLVPRIDDLESTLDIVESLHSEIKAMRNELDHIHEVDETAASTPEKRAAALRKAMVNEFEGTQEPVSWDYGEVKTQLARDGHGTIHDPQAYRAMEDAAEVRGFVEGEIAKDGDTVRGIKLVPENLPEELAVSGGSNEINSGSDNHASQSGGTPLGTDNKTR